MAPGGRTTGLSTCVTTPYSVTSGGDRQRSRISSARSTSMRSSQRICADFGIAADFSRPVPLDAHPRPELAESVVLVTETDGPESVARRAVGRAWPADCSRRPSRSARSPAATLAGDACDRDSRVCAHAGDAVDVLTSCRAVIGVDTGLTHIAAQQGTPTLTICRQGLGVLPPLEPLPGPPWRRMHDAVRREEAAYAYNNRVSLRGFEPQPWTCPSARRACARPRPRRRWRSSGNSCDAGLFDRRPRSSMIDSAAEIGVRNTQPEGIGRVVSFGDLACWNNLGRNVVFADQRLCPLAVFGQYPVPGQDEPSQYDLDIHAVLDVPDSGLVLVLNHLGCVRAFRRPIDCPGPLARGAPRQRRRHSPPTWSAPSWPAPASSVPSASRAPSVLVSAPLEAASTLLAVGDRHGRRGLRRGHRARRHRRWPITPVGSRR